MEFNIAVNTVFYISVFIIPGILLRRSFYFGEFHKEFSQGNLLERLMWMIFSSILALLASSGFFLLIRYWFGNLLPAISYSTVKEIFELLETNDLPSYKRFSEIYVDFLILIFGVYFLSLIIGFLGHKLVVLMGISSSTLFKYKNYWYYFFRGKINRKIIDPDKKYWYTDADILVEEEGKTKLYSGKVSNYYIDSTSNQLETLFLEDVKYKCPAASTDYKPVPGDIFSVPYSRLLNMNLTYVMQTKGVPFWKTAVWFLFLALFYCFIIIGFSLLWIEKVEFFQVPLRIKVLTYVNLLFALSILRSLIKILLFIRKPQRKEDYLRDHVIALAFFLVQYLWILGGYTFASVFITSFSLMVFLMSISGTTKEPPAEADEKGSVPKNTDPSEE